MPGDVTVPSTLIGHAATIWHDAFLSAYSGTCAKRQDKDACAARIAWGAVKRAGFSKGKAGGWTKKAEDQALMLDAPYEEQLKYVQRHYGPAPAMDQSVHGASGTSMAMKEQSMMTQSSIPTPDVIIRSGSEPQGLYVHAYQAKFAETRNVAEAAKAGWLAIRSQCERGEDGLYVKSVAVAEDEGVSDVADAAPESEVVERTDQPNEPMLPATESALADPMITREVRGAANFRSEEGPIILKDVSEVDEIALLDQGYGPQPAARPDEIDDLTWAALPVEQRSVASLIHARRMSRAYGEALKAYTSRGWTAIQNFVRPSEMILMQRDVNGGLRRGVLARPANATGEKAEDWRLQLVRHIAVSLEPSQFRFVGPRFVNDAES